MFFKLVFSNFSKFIFFIMANLCLFQLPIFAQGVPNMGGIDLGAMASEGFSDSIVLLVAMSLIGLIPFFLVTTTSFLRIVIVFSMLRMALATQQSPPNVALIGLAMFMSVFIMTPTINTILETAVTPFQEGRISQKEAMEIGVKPIRNFMLKYTLENDLALFLEFSKVQYTDNYNDVPIFVIIPAFILSELKIAFQIGFLLFIPFLVIDLIISNILLSLGMFMLSPAMISLPFKILLFVLTDGWNLITRGLLLSFQ
ncbi:flagellar biosynthetic protein FliP [bacterium]|nr:flagellar biosynthetic protein FliP [bacterium]|tara:strand:- start:6060 stop:6827 length:768 start_codon:yes stop_codon:yes gene_type:complete